MTTKNFRVYLPNPCWVPKAELEPWRGLKVRVHPGFTASASFSQVQCTVGLVNLTYVLCGACPLKELKEDYVGRVASMVSSFPTTFLENTTVMSPMKFWETQMRDLKRVTPLAAIEDETMLKFFIRAQQRKDKE